jgi:division/cell wall cluster transcriptional repressor MraZ
MAGLFGDSINSIDAKGRVSLASKYRKDLPESVVVMTSLDSEFPSLEIYSLEDFEKFRYDYFLPDGGFQRAKLAHTRLMNKINSRAEKCKIDSAGRITISAKRMAEAKIAGDSEVMMFGNDDHVKVYDAAIYEDYQRSLDDINGFID